jgi:hypothetical protein
MKEVIKALGPVATAVQLQNFGAFSCTCAFADGPTDSVAGPLLNGPCYNPIAYKIAKS